MPEVPKIVHDRLRAAQPHGGHPDADVLTAFAEQALPATERDGVLLHLAACHDCREVVALSTPAVETAAQPGADEEKAPAAAPIRALGRPPSWLSWPNLHWAAAAAGVIVVASVLMLRYGKHQPSLVDMVNEQAEQSRPALPEAKPPLPETAMDTAQPATAATAPAMDSEESRLQLDESRRLRGPVAGRVASAPAVAQPSIGVRAYEIPAERRRRDVTEADKLALKKASPAPGQAVGGAVLQEQVQVSSAAASVSAEAGAVVPATPEQKGILARNEPSIEITKAKPPTAAKEEAPPAKPPAQSSLAPRQELTANAYSSSKQDGLMRKAMATKDTAIKDTAIGAWSLAQGVLFHSEGKTLKVALRAAHPLMAFGARAGDVWAGGQTGILFHSRDNGTTWTQIQPAAKSEPLTSDIVAIDLRSATEIVLTTSNNESWSTSDGGETWQKN